MAVLLSFVCFTTIVSAKTYSVTNTDMSIAIDDSIWYVFTPDNLKDNPEIEDLGLTEEYISDLFTQYSMYVDAMLFFEEGDWIELLVRKVPLDTGVSNLSNYKDSEVLEFTEELAKTVGSTEYELYKTEYKYAKLEYFDTNVNYYIYEFATIINGDDYTFTFQSPCEFTEWEYEEMESIVNSVKFDVDPNAKEENSGSNSNKIWIRTLVGALGGGLGGLIISLVNKKKKQKDLTENTEQPE